RKYMKKLAILAGAMAATSSAFAAGIDSRAYTCTGVQSLIAAQRFVFISQPTFGDFVVSDASLCSGADGGGGGIQVRSVPTQDNPECLVNYCVKRSMSGGGN